MLRAFTRWLASTNRLARDPLRHIKPPAKGDGRRLQRRALSPDEVRWLLAYVDGAPATVVLPKRYRRKGELRTGERRIRIEHRGLLYRLMLGTGFRVSETASLTARDFRLSDSPPTVTVRAAYAKNRREAVQPIRPDLARLLKPVIEPLKPGDRVWPSMPSNMAPVVRADLEAARAAWIAEAGTPADREARERSDFLRHEDAEGRRVDAHAFRHSFCSMLARSNTPLRVVQELARHSDPRLTMSTYSHVRLADAASALDALPGESAPDSAEAAEALATGTHDANPRPDGATYVQHSELTSAPDGAELRIVGEGPADEPDRRKPLDSKGFCASVRPDAPRSRKAACRTRTGDLRFTKPLLYQLS